jgi:hydrophobic/amphiphilic exporter-1 (mainly G- bacteria), HAE1 family
MQLTRLAISRPVAILMLLGAFVVLGLVGYANLPAELNPQVDFPTVSILTTYAGTNPQQMETLITKPIEDSISGVSGIKQINSTSQQGVSNITIQFYFGTNLDTADADVIQKVDAIRKELPIDSDAPAVQKRDTSSQPVLYIQMESSIRPTSELQSMANNIILPYLEQAPDVGGVTVYGGTQREIRVSVSQDRLAALGITLSDLSTAITASNVDVPGGFIQKGQGYYDVRVIGEFQSVDELRNLRLSINGKVFNLSDLATVEDTIAEPTQDSFINGQQSVTLVVQKTSDGNTLVAAKGAKAQLARLKDVLPSDVRFLITTDMSTDVTENLGDVVTSLFISTILAILVVFMFLHNGYGTSIVAIAIPTTLIATFLPLWAVGFSLNTMTLLGLSLAVGILVDDSIVVLENINRHLAMGEEPTDAAINGRTEIGLAAITLTSVDLVVFLPIAFMGGVVGEFFRSFGLTVAFATAFSLLVSFTLTPMLAARWYKKGESMEYTAGFAGAFDRMFFGFERRYQNVLRIVLKRPFLVVIIGNLLLILIFALIGPKLGFRFAPDQDEDQVAVSIEGAAGESLSYTRGISKQIEDIIHQTPDLNNDVQFVYTADGSSSSSGTGSGVTGTQYSTMSLTLYDRASILDSIKFWDHEHLRHRSDVDVALEISKLTKNIVGAKILASNVSGFSGGGAPLSVSLNGPDLDQLLVASNKVEDLFRSTPGTYNTDTSFKNSQPEVEVRVDRTLAPEYGLTLQQIAQAVSDNIGGNIDSKYRDPADGQQYDIRVQLAYNYRNDPLAIGQTIVGYQNNGTTPVYLSDVASLTVGAGPTKIDRLNRERSIAISAYLLPGVAVGNIAVVVNKKLAAMQKAGEFGQVTYTFGGETQSLQDEGGYIIVAVLLGIILSYMLMAALFNNVLYPLSIMLSLPQAWAGAMIALLIAQEPMNLIAMIGFLYLNAIVGKNAILLIDYTNTLRARGYKRIDALLEAGPTRMRPIMMTSICVVAASLPTALALGRGSSFRQSLGVSVLGGVTLSLALTLIIVPCSYVLWDNFGNWVGRFNNRRSYMPPLSLREPPTMPDGTSDGSLVGRPPI